MWVTKLLISQVKKRIFCPKLAFLVNLGQAMQAYSVLCWWVGWWLWRAGCISQDTYLLYMISLSLWHTTFLKSPIHPCFAHYLSIIPYFSPSNISLSPYLQTLQFLCLSNHSLFLILYIFHNYKQFHLNWHIFVMVSIISL